MSETLFGDRELVVYRPALALALGSPLAALFLCQALYWQERAGIGRWWYKLRDAERDENGNMLRPTTAHRQSWEFELGMCRSEQETARRVLSVAGLLKIQRRGVPAKNYYLLDIPKLRQLLVTIETARSRQPAAGSSPASGQDIPSIPTRSGQLASEISPPINTEVTPYPTPTIDAVGVSFNDISNSIAPVKTEVLPATTAIFADLVYPRLDAEIIEQIRIRLAPCPLDLQQLVLDEIEGQRILGFKKSAIGFAHIIVQKAIQRTFLPNLAIGVALDRAKRREREIVIAGSMTASPVEVAGIRNSEHPVDLAHARDQFLESKKKLIATSRTNKTLRNDRRGDMPTA